MPEEHDVIVIGAGMAGLACAQKLAAASVDFLLLEAADRACARITRWGVAPRAKSAR